VISGIQESITRKLDPLDPVVITFGKINGGNAFNVLAEKVNLIGTVRCTNLKLFKNIGNWLNENITSLANSCGAEAKVIFREITPAVNNNSEINRVLRDSGIKVLGQENVIELQKPSLGAEDFAEFLKDIPGAMFRLGVSSSNGCAPLHSSKFDPDERAIDLACRFGYSVPNAYKSLGGALKELIEKTRKKKKRSFFEDRLDALRKSAEKARSELSQQEGSEKSVSSENVYGQ